MENKDIKEDGQKVFKNPKTKSTKKSKDKPKTDKEIIKGLENKIKKQKENYLTALADLENDRKRFEKSKNEFIKFSNGKVLEELITILDTFNMAMNIKEPSAEVKNFLVGFEMIKNQFNNLLQNNGVTKLEIKPGDEFNSEFHFSMEEVESKDFQPGQISEVIKQGYKIHDRLLRPAMVKVAKSKDKTK